jgi:undecaprenyl-diphosphatase
MPDTEPMVPMGPVEPVEERLARRLGRPDADPGAWIRRRAVQALHHLARYDRAVYRSVAQMETPLLDQPMRKVSDFANHSKPWFVVAGALAMLGGPPGRRAAVTGLVAVGAASLVVNQPLKMAGERRRPDREGLGVPPPRWVRMPKSTSFPSGHSASAAAFAVAVGDLQPSLRLPLTAAASVVGFSRVYTGVHHPSDVLVGAMAGALLGRLVSRSAMQLGSVGREKR